MAQQAREGEEDPAPGHQEAKPDGQEHSPGGSAGKAGRGRGQGQHEEKPDREKPLRHAARRGGLGVHRGEQERTIQGAEAGQDYDGDDQEPQEILRPDSDKGSEEDGDDAASARAAPPCA